MGEGEKYLLVIKTERHFKMEHMDACAEFRNNWVKSLSDDDRAKMAAEKAAWTNEETKAERMAEFAATFQTNDTNADG